MNSHVADRLTAAGMSVPEARKKSELFAKIERQLAAESGGLVMRWFVPGRIEVLGKHTDYAGGRSLLCSVERGFCVATTARDDSRVRICDVIRDQAFEFTISPDLPVPDSSWRLYAAVVARRIARNFPGAVQGADITVASDLPSAAGMSSSSALVVAIYAALSAVNRIDERAEYRANIATPEELAGYLGCVENGQTFKSLAGDAGVGTFGGSEDHTAILCSEAGKLKQYSFSPVRLERTVQLPSDCTFVIGVSGVVADKSGSAKDRYNRASLGVRSILEIWRSVSGSKAATLAEAAGSSPNAPEQIRAALREHPGATDSLGLLDRFEQFWEESEVISPKAGVALACHDLEGFAELVAESQAGAEKLLRNQVPETMWLVREARALGALAASAFGAGFGGSV
ncbi:MAG TPA: galactokinase family protein, partial [Terriglobales bacterium]